MRFITPSKILHHVDRLIELRQHGDTAPINVQICPYDAQCNHACPACTAGFKGFTGAVMETAVFARIVDELKAVGCRSITLTGGSEPTLHPDFDGLIDALVGIDAGLITNGEAITREIAARLKRQFIWVRVSLDAANPERFKRMHGVETFGEVLCAIDRLTEAQGDATIGIAFLTTPTSACVDGIGDCVRLARELGADYAQFRPLLKTANGRERPWIYTQRHRQLIDALREAEKLSTPEFRVDFNEEKYRRIEGAEVKPYSRCGFVEIAPAISASGNVSVCCHHMEREEFLIGNIHERSFEDLWYSQLKRHVIERLPLEVCPLLCRAVGINEMMAGDIPEQIVEPNRHANFI